MDGIVQKIRQKEIVIILGMHRSGTSLTAQICKKMGIYLGEETELMQADRYNRSGYFENQKISDLDDEVLRKCGKTWFSLQKPDAENEAAELWETKGELQTIINGLLDRSDIVGIKDPRISVLLPFWDSLLSELNVSIKYLWVIRDPERVVASLAERDGFNREFAYRLWCHYNLCIWEFLKDRDYLKFDYQDILNSKDMAENKFAIADKIAEFTGLTITEKDICGLDDVIHPEYCHGHQGFSLTGSNFVSAYEFYEMLKTEEAKMSNMEKWINHFIRTAARADEKYIDCDALFSKDYLQTKHIIIYGAGNYGKKFAEKLRNMGVFNYDFCDKDTSRHGQEYCGGKVFSMGDIEKQENLLIVVALGDEYVRREIEESMAYISGALLLPYFTLSDEIQTF